MTNNKGSGRKGDKSSKKAPRTNSRLMIDWRFMSVAGERNKKKVEGKGKAGKVSSAGSDCSPGLLSSCTTTPAMTKGQRGNKIRILGDYFVFSDYK